MDTRWRLDSKAPGLASLFRRAAPDKRRNAALAACESVVRAVGLEVEDDVRVGLRAVREGSLNDSELGARLSVLSARFDEEYFRLDEENDEAKKSDALRFFAKARAAAALALALSGDASELHEAIYEAMSALVNDPSDVAQAVEAALRPSTPS